MAKIELKLTCSCGASFYGRGDAYSLNFRLKDWLDQHKPCQNKKVE